MAPAPVNDLYASRTLIASALPATVAGAHTQASVESGEVSASTKTVWYGWTSTVTALVKVRDPTLNALTEVVHCPSRAW